MAYADMIRYLRPGSRNHRPKISGVSDKIVA